MPAGNLLVGKLAILRAIAVSARSVGEAGVLGPDSAVDDADDDVLASDPVRTCPDAKSGPLRPRKSGVDEVSSCAKLVLCYGQHALGLRQFLGLFGSQFGGEAAEHESIAVKLLAGADAREQRVLPGSQKTHVADDGRRIRVDLLALARSGRGIALDAAGVGNDRVVGQLHDIGVVRELLLSDRLALPACRRGGEHRLRQRCNRDERGRRQPCQMFSTHDSSLWYCNFF